MLFRRWIPESDPEARDHACGAHLGLLVFIRAPGETQQGLQVGKLRPRPEPEQWGVHMVGYPTDSAPLAFLGVAREALQPPAGRLSCGGQ